ncbi:MAG: hypothetical protein LPH21_03270, partial [Shewanella sp.]|nr:hypothetical protein [Shewanella sp.]
AVWSRGSSTMPTSTYNALQHLIIAERVCDYVGQKMTKGSPDKPIDMAHSRMRHESQMRDFKVYYDNLPSFLQPTVWRWRPKPDLHKNMLKAQRKNNRHNSSDPYKWVLGKAFFAEQSGIGTCTDQAAVGFRYLCNCTKCEVFSVVDIGFDHVFIVIGAGKDDVEGYYRFNKVPYWPANAVICDPWYNEWFIVKKDWCLKMRLILEAAEQEQPANLTSLAIGVIPIRCFVQGPGPV